MSRKKSSPGCLTVILVLAVGAFAAKVLGFLFESPVVVIVLCVFAAIGIIVWAARSFRSDKTFKQEKTQSSPQPVGPVMHMEQKPAIKKAANMGNIQSNYQKREALRKTYDAVLRRHDMLREQIGTRYTIAREKYGYTSAEMEAVIALCRQDIALAGAVLDYHKRDEALFGYEVDPRGYFDTFQRLAIIYEKQGKYEDAISVCKDAISYGILKDGTQGGMEGRIARLENKMKKVGV